MVDGFNIAGPQVGPPCKGKKAENGDTEDNQDNGDDQEGWECIAGFPSIIQGPVDNCCIEQRCS